MAILNGRTGPIILQKGGGKPFRHPLPNNWKRTPDRFAWLFKAVWDPLWVTLLYFLLLTPFLGERPLLAPDEGRYASVSLEMFTSGDFVLPRLNGILFLDKPPLLYWGESAAFWLLGPGEWSARLVMLLAGFLTTYLVWLTARNLFGRSVGLFTALIQTSCFGGFVGSRVVITDGIFVAMLTGCLLFWLLGSQESRPERRFRYILLSAIFCALAVLSKGLIGLVFPGLAILLFCWATGRWNLARQSLHPIHILAFLIIALPWHISAALREPGFLNHYFVIEHFLRFLSDIHGRSQPFWFYLPVLFFGLLPWVFQAASALGRPMGIMIVDRIRRWSQMDTFERRPANEPKTSVLDQPTQFLLIVIGVMFVFFSVANSKLGSYLLPIFPLISILTGQRIAFQTRRRKGSLIEWSLSGLLLLGLSAFPLWLDRVSPIPLTLEANDQFTLQVFLLLASIFAFSLAAYGSSVRFRLFAISGLAFAMVFSFLQIDRMVSKGDVASVRQHAWTIAALKQPSRWVVSFEHFFRDLPFYLREPVAILGHGGELQAGAMLEPSDHVFMNQDRFKKLWRGEDLVVAVVQPKRNDSFFKLAGPEIYVICRSPFATSYANQPPSATGVTTCRTEPPDQR